MSMIMTQNAWTIQHPFKVSCNNKDQAWLWHIMHHAQEYSIPSRSAATTKTKHDYDTECMNNTASLQGQLQQQRQSAKLKKRQKNEKIQESYSSIPLTKSIPLVTFQPEISWLKAIAPSKKYPCESRRSGSILLLIINRRNVWDHMFDDDDEHDYNTECMNKNMASLQGQQKQRQCAEELKRRKNEIPTALCHLQIWLRC